VAIASDASIGFATESTFRTFATPTRWVEFTDESLKFTKNTKQGMGLRVGSNIPRSPRRTNPTAAGKGDLTFELAAKGQSLLWKQALGANTHTLVSAATYQSVSTFGNLSSMSVQKGIPQVGGSVDAYSFLGVTVDTIDIDSVNGDIVTCKLGLDIGDLTTAQSYTTPVYVTEPQELIHFGEGVAQLGGSAPTDATTTALASMTAPITTGIRSFSLSVKNNIDVGRYNYGASGRKAMQVNKLRSVTGKFVGEYDQTTVRDAFLNDTKLPLILTFTGSALGTGNVTFQIYLPEVKLDSDIPVSNKGELVTIEHSFTVLDNLSNTPLQIIQRTADTAP
jgi:Phage tail tube protein